MLVEASAPPTVDRHTKTYILEYLSFAMLGALSPSCAVFPSTSGLFLFPRILVSAFPRFLVSRFGFRFVSHSVSGFRFHFVSCSGNRFGFRSVAHSVSLSISHIGFCSMILDSQPTPISVPVPDSVSISPSSRQSLITDSHLARPRRVRSCGSRPRPITPTLTRSATSHSVAPVTL